MAILQREVLFTSPFVMLIIVSSQTTQTSKATNKSVISCFPTPCVVSFGTASFHRALLAILRSGMEERAQRLPGGAAAAASPPTMPSQEVTVNPASSVLPPSTNAATALHPVGSSAADAAVAPTGAATAAVGGDPVTTVASNASSTGMEVVGVGNDPNSDETQAAVAVAAEVAAAQAPSPSSAAQDIGGGAAPVAGAPVSGATPAPAASGKGPAMGDSGGSTQEGGGEVEKRALESAWSLYLQVTIICGLCPPCAFSRPGPRKDRWVLNAVMFRFYVLGALCHTSPAHKNTFYAQRSCISPLSGDPTTERRLACPQATSCKQWNRN